MKCLVQPSVIPVFYCQNEACIFAHEIQPVEFQYSKYVTPIAPIIVKRICVLSHPQIEDAMIESHDILYNIGVCKQRVGRCEKKVCLWNNNGCCSRNEMYVDQRLIGDDSLWVCRTYSDKHVSGHIDWSRYPQGGNIDSDYAEKLNLEATKFKSFSKGHHEARELPSYVEKQHKEWEKDRLRQKWTDNQARKHTKRVRIKP